ncbi:hypothetical protein BJ322DRAFT_630825 [Thelephora terrestris]|uniref:Uncharacterized protein n=1 Tax=Thelephora terrestris TaxID=56493 RepID=A0A9P6HJ90_9AGAM|nr:hypothetical protein BJ322DRAFT_630825 [Thelephora terrestris]
MTQPVTTLSSSELASELEELSSLGSRIARTSYELRTMLQSDPSDHSASTCALLRVALSNAQGCLSLLQSMVQAPVHSPSSPPHSPPVISPYYSLTPAPVPTDPLFVPRSSRPVMIGTPHLPDISLDISFPSRPTPIQSTPLLPTRTTLESSQSIPGVRSASEHSPSSPRLSNQSPTRHGMSIAELVDEENSSPGTRGGVNHSSYLVAARRNLPATQNYPLLTISIVDATPHSTRSPGGPDVLGSRPLRSPPRSPWMSPANNCLRTTSEGGRALRRSTRRGVPPTAPESPDQRMTRSRTKRKATGEFEVANGPSKRTKTSSPQ